MIRRGTPLVMLVLATTVLLPSTAVAQERYPAKAVTLIVAGGAGEGLDLAARAFADFAQRQGLTGSVMTGAVLDRFVEGDVEALRVTMQSLGLLAR